MKDPDAPTPGAEMDVLKIYVWGMLGVTVIFAGLAWWWDRQEGELRRAVESARARLPELAQEKREVQAMLKVYKTNKEDEARRQPFTWFTTIWKRKGIPEVSVQLGAWKNPPEPGPDGSYLEEKIGVKFQQKNPLTRAQIGQFLHEVERSSTRLRVLELSVKRNGRDETIEEDAWNGDAVIGYRVPDVDD